MKKSLILGYGITGKSFANYLTKKKLKFEIYDKNFEGKNFIAFPEYKYLKNYKAPVSSKIYSGDGELIQDFSSEKRIFIPYNSIPKIVINSFLSVLID